MRTQATIGECGNQEMRVCASDSPRRIQEKRVVLEEA